MYESIGRFDALIIVICFLLYSYVETQERGMWEGNGGMGEWGMRNENLEKGESVNRGMNI